jgi:hypothetical protein
MNWRKWLVRGLVFTVAGGLLLAGLVYQAWTSPAAVRRLVLLKLSQRFAGTLVRIDRARLRLFGGIVLSDVRMARRDDLDQLDFLYVPSAVVYHDKEHLLSGKVGIRKVVCHRPRLRIVRRRDGTWNLEGLLGRADTLERCPTLVCKQGTLRIEDHATPHSPTLEISDIDLTVLNDPPAVLVFEGSGRSDLTGPIAIRGRFWRASSRLLLQLEVPEVPVGPGLVQRLGAYCPDLTGHLRHLRGLGSLNGSVAYTPDAADARFVYRLDLALRKGGWTHARLPFPLEQIEAEAHCVNGRVSRGRLQARSGPAQIELNVGDLDLPGQLAGDKPIEHLDFHTIARTIDLKVDHLPVTRELFARLPANLRYIEQDYSPEGDLSVTYTYRSEAGERGAGSVKREGSAERSPPGRKEWVLRPEGMKATATCFPYPVHDLRGTIRMIGVPGRPLRAEFDLSAKAGESPIRKDEVRRMKDEEERPSASSFLLPPSSIRLKGHIVCAGKASEVDLELRAGQLLLDDRIYRALPEASQKLAHQFLPQASRLHGLRAYPMGRADARVSIRKAPGREDFANHYVITFRGARVLYDYFPYPLTDVTGVLDIRPDGWECRDFQGRHGQGILYVQIQSRAAPGPAVGGGRPADVQPPNVVKVSLQGRGIRLDDPDFVRALTPLGRGEPTPLQKAWETLALAGRMNFAAEVLNRPGQPQDIDVGVEIKGCTMKPRFFPYAMDQVTGQVRYARHKVYLTGISARHGETALGVRSGLIVLDPAGGFQTWLKGLRASHLKADEALLGAVPTGLCQILEPLDLDGAIDMETDLCYRVEPEKPPEVWWEGGVALREASLRVGVEASRVDGQFSSRGHHNGERLVGVEGDFLLDRATVLGQPVRTVHGRVVVRPDTPGVLRLYDLKGELFGGHLGGEARVEFGPTLRYEVLLETLGVSLNEFGKHNLGKEAREAQLEGPMRASVHLTGEGKELAGLKGNGRVDINKAKMGQLPLLLDLVKAVGLRMPDRTAFEQGHMLFRIDGPRLHIEQLDLYGNAISLRGAGKLNLDGSNVQLDFHADWARINQLLPPGVQEIPRTLSDQLLKIKMRGSLGKGGKVRYEKELVPLVVSPIKRVFGPR